MKKPAFYLAFAAMLLMFSCGQGTKDNKQAEQARKDSLIKNNCFIAVDGKDTANLKIKTLDNGKVTGALVINYLDKGKNDGLLEGKFSGDTLFADYTFKIGKTNPTVYKNPLAFLKKDGKMILGVGQIETNLGKSYFVKGKPISFEKGRFTFSPQDCKD